MRTDWRDGDRARAVEASALGGSRYLVSVDGAPMEVAAERLPDGRLVIETPTGHFVAEVSPAGTRRFVRLDALEFVLDLESGGRRRGPRSSSGGLEAPMPGVVTRVMVAGGDEVSAGQPLLALEAMKMEHVIRSPRAGTVKSVLARVGEMVAGGRGLVELEPDATDAG
ncbi:MAG: biotin/lipoyl-binding protein [Candidatus Eisenbacteria bacterium]|nr:biotin/lipoyl-binding protein [Candidatus Eisenbacteria bacterium]